MTVVKFPPRQALAAARLYCTACGAEATASCNCGVACIPADEYRARRKREAERMYKEGSTMEQIAKQLSVSAETISQDLRGFQETGKPSRPKGGRPKSSGKTRKVPRKTAPAIERAVASAVLDKGKTQKAAAQEAGAGSEQVVKTAVAREEGRRELMVELLDAATTKNFTDKGKLTIDAAIRIHKARLEAENKIYLDKQIDFHIKRLKTEHLPKWEEDAKQARLSREQYQKLVNNHKPPLTKIEYQMILLTAHEDNSASLETRKRAMIILNNKKFVLTGER